VDSELMWRQCDLKDGSVVLAHARIGQLISKRDLSVFGSQLLVSSFLSAQSV
jgi:hypothetical protein